MMSKKEFALIGSPLGHSVSPFIHSELFRLSGVNADYRLIEVKGEDLKSEYENTLSGLSGFNVTIPHKTNIIPLLDSLSEKAELFGAVNTVRINDGRAIGYNTDCEGFLRSLRMADMTLDGRVLVLGCGGVSRMFAFESLLAGADVTLAIRKSSTEKAEKLRNEIRSKLEKDVNIAMLDDINDSYNLIINGTPVGMFPAEDSSPISESLVKKSGAVFDAIYNPSETKLIKYAKDAEIKYLNGLPMLVLQAAAAQEIWFDTSFENDKLEKVIALCEKELIK